MIEKLWDDLYKIDETGRKKWIACLGPFYLSYVILRLTKALQRRCFSPNPNFYTKSQLN